MYYKSIAVFFLCTAFVVAFAVVLNYEAAGVGSSQSAVSPSCSPAGTSEGFHVTSARLRTVNYTDELGVVNYAVLSLGVEPSGTSAMRIVGVCVGSSPAGTIQGPFEPGVNRAVNLTLPETISISPGKTYTLSLKGFYGAAADAWETTTVTAT